MRTLKNWRGAAIAAFVACAGFASHAAPADDPDNWRPTDPENLILFKTTKGDVLIELTPDFAPQHAAQLRAIVRAGHYDGTEFHRVIEGFMAQGGDVFAMNGEGTGLDDIPGEFTFRRAPAETPVDFLGDPADSNFGFINGFPVKTQSDFLADMTADGKVETWGLHCPGVTSMARTSDPNSANSQFFLVTDTADWLDKQYTAWGRMLSGLEVARSMNKGEPPRSPDILTSAQMVADMPADDQPKAWVMRTDGPEFSARLAEAAASETSICDMAPADAVVEF
ncbi:MAG: peptidylprolyl isomerase [Pseudomonadota bacterium]